MRLITRKSVVPLLVACLFVTVPGFSEYEIVWYTIDGGGGVSIGGPYKLTGTIGQPDATWSSGDEYELLGGFWPGGPLCFVEFGDFVVFAELWLIGDVAGDLDSDEDIDFGDLQLLTDYWLSDCPYKWPLR